MKSAFDNFPVAPKRYPFFYGWVVLIMGTLGVMASVPGQTLGVAAFTDHLIDALGISRVSLSVAYMLGTIASSLLLTYGGKLYDRFGARVVAPAACILMGLVLVALSQCDRIARGISELTGTGGSTAIPFAVVVLLFFGLRFSGQGIMTMVSRNMVMKWFEKYRGFVMGFLGMAVLPAFNAAPKFMNLLVLGLGWRTAWISMAMVIGLGFALLAILLFRDNPEDCGLIPDGPLHNRKKGRENGETERRQFTLAEARRTYSFWIFALALSLFGLFVTGLGFHVSSIFKTAGLSRSAGFGIFIPGVVISMSLRPVAGWLSDRIELKWLLGSMLAGIAISGLGVSVLTPGLTKWIIVAGNGISGATFGLLAGVTWPDFFGRKHMGAISGCSMAIMVFASAIGPSVFSISKFLVGSYDVAAMVCLCMAAVLLAATFRADNPQGQRGGESKKAES